MGFFAISDPVNHPQEPVGVPLLSGEHAVLCRWGHHSDEVFIITIIIPGLMGVFSFHFNYGKGGTVCGGILFVDIYIFYYSTLIISVFFAKFLKNAPSNINQNHFYVNYGNEQSGILYGEIWLGSQVLDQSEDFVKKLLTNQRPLFQAFIAQSCGEDCAMWCDVDERRMWSAYFWNVQQISMLYCLYWGW